MESFKSMIPKRIMDKYNVNCKIAGKHVHLYQKVTELGTISKYIHGERKVIDGYKQTEQFMRSNRFYDDVLRLLNKNQLFRAEYNMDYLKTLMANNNDFPLEYEYESIEEDIKFEIDEDGNSIPLIYTDKKKGWHKDINDKNNTGKVRRCKPMYYGYKIIIQNDKPILVQSPLVSNINDLLNEYPYYREDCYEIIKEELPQYDDNSENVKKM